MFSARIVLVFAMVTGLTMGACSREKAAKERPASAGGSVLVGKITLINIEENYVLIDGGSLPAPEAGAMLKASNGGVESAELQATSVRRRPFIIADIKSGQPRVGDRVEMPRYLEAPAPVESALAVPESPALMAPAR